ncbi:MAG: 16S rRNA (adenine(1518)-N(6)/adenine(1519)-N(6))-dimethyltransferase RsmA [Propionibacteriaceae bacterium]|jgi:16S rRNA (adenine1518-N6/adenine1519-N6)-dimethyltransferase|nr:16S rRNA (adenine(1518)-N(6)/adenine(1519)-N(6))-dimethyltransferase RsmA [Propionibacteriaceae bacterium]
MLDPRTLRAIAAEIGLRPSKQRGQNFVHDANTVRRIVAAAGVGPDDVVLEVGPGLGSLTLGLLEAGCQVVAVEIEPALAARLPQTVAEQLPAASGRLSVIQGDALRCDIPARPGKLVANLPYNVSVPVLLHLLATLDSLTSGLVMVQSEVADRLVAAPGSKVYGVPSAKLAWYADAVRIGSVPPSVFWPVPNVDSGLVRLTRHAALGDEAARLAAFRVVDAAFAQRRKTLRQALAGLFGTAGLAQEALLAAGVDPSARGEVLDITDYRNLAAHLPTREHLA